MKNLFRLLGVGLDATDDELKSAYRQGAAENHPDKGGARERFEEIAAAYKTLSDPEKRAEYLRARRLWIESVGAVECPACGEANAIKGRGKRPICGAVDCGAELPEPSAAAQLRERTAEALADVGERVRAHVSELVVDGIDLGFEKLRRKIGIARRTTRGSR